MICLRAGEHQEAQVKVDQKHLGAARQVGNRPRFLRKEGRMWRQIEMWRGIFWGVSKYGFSLVCALNCDPKLKRSTENPKPKPA
jgi:hypothetical protein